MAQLEKVDLSSFETVYGELLRLLDSKRPRAEWRRIFEPGWRQPEDYSGYCIVENGEVVGFLGLIFS